MLGDGGLGGIELVIVELVEVAPHLPHVCQLLLRGSPRLRRLLQQLEGRPKEVDGAVVPLDGKCLRYVMVLKNF